MKQRYAEIFYIDHKGLDKSIIINLLIADRFSSASFMMGAHASPSENEALLLSPCKYIHTFFMRYSVDALFLDKEYYCIEYARNIRPWKFGTGNLKAKHVLVLASQNLMGAAVLIDRVKFLEKKEYISRL